MSAAGTTITLKNTLAEQAIAEAVSGFIKFTREAKEKESLADMAKKKIKDWAEARWLKLYGDSGLLPAAPFKVVTPEGQSVSFVVQDKSDGCELKPEAVTDLVAVLGENADVLEDTIRFSFDSAVLTEPSKVDKSLPVGAIAAGRIAGLLAGMVAVGDITQDQANRLFQARKVQILKPSLLGRLPELTARAGASIKEVLSVIGSAVTQYVR